MSTIKLLVLWRLVVVSTVLELVVGRQCPIVACPSGGSTLTTQSFGINGSDNNATLEMEQQQGKERQNTAQTQSQIGKSSIGTNAPMTVIVKCPKHDEILIGRYNQYTQKESHTKGGGETFENKRPEHPECNMDEPCDGRRNDQCLGTGIRLQIDHWCAMPQKGNKTVQVVTGKGQRRDGRGAWVRRRNEKLRKHAEKTTPEARRFLADAGGFLALASS